MDLGDPGLRASDAERERTAAALREHAAAGRLTAEELSQRADAAFAARTVGDLRALLADLPGLPAAAPRAGHDAALEASRRRVLHGAGVWALLGVAAVALWLATGAGWFWPLWLLLGGGIRFAFLAWSELGPGAEERRRIGRGSAATPRDRR